jgi:hypothetical protein
MSNASQKKPVAPRCDWLLEAEQSRSCAMFKKHWTEQ